MGIPSPFPPPDFHTLGRERGRERERERESSLYVTGGGAVTAKANPNSLLLRHRSITVSVTASEVRPSEVGSMQKTFPPDLRKKEGSSERERASEGGYRKLGKGGKAGCNAFVCVFV